MSRVAVKIMAYFRLGCRLSGTPGSACVKEVEGGVTVLHVTFTAQDKDVSPKGFGIEMRSLAETQPQHRTQAPDRGSLPLDRSRSLVQEGEDELHCRTSPPIAASHRRLDKVKLKATRGSRFHKSMLSFWRPASVVYRFAAKHNIGTGRR